MAQPAEPDIPAYPVDIDFLGAQAVMHVTQQLTELVQQTRSPQWRRSHGGDFVGSVGSAYEYGISEFPNVIKCLSEWVKLCWSADSATLARFSWTRISVASRNLFKNQSLT